MIDYRPGTVVLVSFPFSDLSSTKRRPAVVIADAGRGDWICAQITSKSYADPNAIQLTDRDFRTGSLQRVSYLRPAKLFTAYHGIFERILAELDDGSMLQVRDAVIAMIARSSAANSANT